MTSQNDIAKAKKRRNNMNNGKTNNKNMKKVVLALVALVALIAILIGVYSATKEDTVEGQKTITVAVVHGDGSEKEFEYETTREYLGEVLDDEALVEGEEGDYGLFITSVDGEEANSANEEWWCLTIDGESAMTSADQTVIEDGDHFELTLTVGY